MSDNTENLPKDRKEREQAQHKEEVDQWLEDSTTRLFFQIIAAEAYAAREEMADLALMADSKAFASAAKLEFARWVLDETSADSKTPGGAVRILRSLADAKSQIAQYEKQVEERYIKKEHPKEK